MTGDMSVLFTPHQIIIISHHSDLGCSGHVNTSLQEVAEVLAKLAGGSGQVLSGPSGSLDHLVG